METRIETTKIPDAVLVPDENQIRRAPKALLHDHLDGGLRPQTVIELADQYGYTELPEFSGGADGLGRWFAESADSGSLPRYLETFQHTVGVMQNADALFRVAAECAEDLAADGVIYAESRYAPEQHLDGGLTLDEVVEAADAGIPQGDAGTAGRLRARQADPAGDVPDVEPPDRGRRVLRHAPDRAASVAVLPGHGQHRQPADESDFDDEGVRRAGEGALVHARRFTVVHDKRPQVGVPGLRPAAEAHQRGRETGLRGASRRGRRAFAGVARG